MSMYVSEASAADWREKLTRRRYLVGVDLGQAMDFTAISVIERLEVPRIAPGFMDGGEVPHDTHWHLRHLQRLPLGMAYPVQVEMVRQLLQRAPLNDPASCRLVVDQSGVGRAVVDLFRAAKMQLAAVTITGGDSWSRAGMDYRVSKFILCTHLQAAIHSNVLLAAADLPDRQALVQELSNFQVSLSEQTGAARFSAREGKHDDLVLSVAIAFWFGRVVGARVVETRSFN